MKMEKLKRIFFFFFLEDQTFIFCFIFGRELNFGSIIMLFYKLSLMVRAGQGVIEFHNLSLSPKSSIPRATGF